jgi:hypothetical protein
MTRRFSIFVLALFLALVTFSPAFAYSPTAFNGGATSQSLDLALDLTVAELSIDIGTMEAVQSFDEVNPPTTAGAGEGINVAVAVGDPDLGLDLINVASQHTLGDGPDADTDSDSLIDVDTDLIDVGALAMDTSSLTTEAAVNTNMNWSLAGLVVYGDILGTSELVSTDAITGTADTDVDNEGTLVSTGHTQIDGLVLEVPFQLATLELVSADVISTTASAGSDGSEGGAFAYANTEFVNLRIQGEEISNTDPGTVIDLELLNLNIGSVTIRPVEMTSVTPTQSSAEAVALRIEILEVLGLIGAEIDVGTTTAQAGVQPGFPTAVTMTDMRLTTGDNLPYAFLALGVLGGLFGVIVARRKK